MYNNNNNNKKVTMIDIVCNEDMKNVFIEKLKKRLSYQVD